MRVVIGHRNPCCLSNPPKTIIMLGLALLATGVTTGIACRIPLSSIFSYHLHIRFYCLLQVAYRLEGLDVVRQIAWCVGHENTFWNGFPQHTMICYPLILTISLSILDTDLNNSRLFHNHQAVSLTLDFAISLEKFFQILLYSMFFEEIHVIVLPQSVHTVST